VRAGVQTWFAFIACVASELRVAWWKEP
jgi:hypothetical protein